MVDDDERRLFDAGEGRDLLHLSCPEQCRRRRPAERRDDGGGNVKADRLR